MLKSLVLLASIGSAAAIPGYITHLTWDGKYLARGPRTVKYGVEYFGDGSPVFASSTNKTGTQWNVAFDYVKYVQDGLCLDAGSDSGYSLSFKPSVLPALWFVDPHTLPVRIPSPLSLSRPDPSSVPSTLRLPLPSVPSALRRPFLRPFSSSFPSSSNHRLPKHVQGTLTEDPVAGTKVHLWTCHGQAQQQWVVANGQVKLAGKNLCLDVTDGDPSKQVQVWDCVPGSKNQKFDAAPEGSVGGQC